MFWGRSCRGSKHRPEIFKVIISSTQAFEPESGRRGLVLVQYEPAATMVFASPNHSIVFVRVACAALYLGVVFVVFEFNHSEWVPPSPLPV